MLLLLYNIHASALREAAKIQPIEFQNQEAEAIRSLAFSPVDGRPHPASGSMGMLALALFIWTPCTYRNIGSTICFFNTGCQKKTLTNGLMSLLEGGAMV